MSDLASLLERVKAASGWDSQLDRDILRYLGFTWRGMAYWNNDNQMWKGRVDFTASIDVALALVERKLPGWSWEVRRSGFCVPSQARLWDPVTQPGFDFWVPDAATPPLALIAALLTALIAREGESPAKGGE